MTPVLSPPIHSHTCRYDLSKKQIEDSSSLKSVKKFPEPLELLNLPSKHPAFFSN
jgi:hypothetical protein